jgi:c-di-GMP-binding flagellar brake protein YcgR
MNKRIRELAKQTGYIWHASGEPQIYEFTPEKLEKFAELIVLECVSVVEDTNDRHRRDYFAAKIKQHFGIQE